MASCSLIFASFGSSPYAPARSAALASSSGAKASFQRLSKPRFRGRLRLCHQQKRPARLVF